MPSHHRLAAPTAPHHRPPQRVVLPVVCCRRSEPTASASPSPVVRVVDEARCHRVVFDVVADRFEVSLVSHIAVPVVWAPKPAGSTDMADRSGGVPFPRLNHLRQRPGRRGFNENVDVVRHDHPAQQPVPFGISKEQGVFDDACVLRVTKDTRSKPFVEARLNVLAALQTPLVFGQGFQLSVQLRQQLLRKAISQMERDVLEDSGNVEMRQSCKPMPRWWLCHWW